MEFPLVFKGPDVLLSSLVVSIGKGKRDAISPCSRGDPRVPDHALAFASNFSEG
jgi:hypothetical protein